MKSVIETRQLVKNYGSLCAIDQLSLVVEEGEVFGLLGPNGAGKTTMIRVLNGILPREGGEVSVLGLDPQEHGDAIRQNTGVLTEAPALYERLSARENLRFTGRMWDIPEGELDTRVDDSLAMFDLTDRANDQVGGYSKGMKQRMALARAFLSRPPLLFLDEPTSGLDPESARQVNTLIETMSRSGNHTVFLCTHLLHEAQRLCNRVAVIHQGRLLALGSPAELALDLFPEVRLIIGLTETLPDGVLAETAGLDFVGEVSKGENHSLLVQIRDQAGVPALVAWLVEKGAKICSVVPQEVTLEDVYFTLQSRANGGVK